MSYPEVWLTQPIRRAIMATWILLFFIISPLIILYTIGYRFDTEKYIIKQTGVLSVEVKPEDASVSINDVLIDKEMPFELTNRAPGYYHVYIDKPGFHTWEKDIEVFSKQTSYVHNIYLLEDNLPIPIFEDLKNVISFNVSNKGRYAVVVIEKDSFFETYHIDMKKDKKTLLVRAKTKVAPVIDFSPFDETIFIAYENKKTKQYTLELISADEIDKRKAYSIASLPVKGEYSWIKKKGGSSLQILDNRIITTFDITSKNRYGLAIHDVVLADNNGMIWEFSKKDKKIISKEHEIKVDREITKILHVDEKIMLAYTENGMMIIDRTDDGHTQEISAIEIKYEVDTEKWLAWSKWEFWEIDQEGDVKLLNRAGNEIKQIFSINEHSAVGIVSNNTINIFDPVYNTEHLIFDTGDIEHIFVDKKEKKLLFLGTVANKHGIFELEY